MILAEERNRHSNVDQRLFSDSEALAFPRLTNFFIPFVRNVRTIRYFAHLKGFTVGRNAYGFAIFGIGAEISMIAEIRSRLSREEVENIRELCRRLITEDDPKKWQEIVEKLKQVIQRYLAPRRPN